MATPDLDTVLREHFGFTAFRLGQREAIEHALARRDALVVMPTGSGKSLCYQLPALISDGATLVISPLIALMKDQVDALTASGKRATFINSTLAANEHRARLGGVARGEYKIVYVAPERLRNTDFLTALKSARIVLLAVDEAHCISQWGHDFRPDYQHLREFIPQIGSPPVFALTATATPQVQSDILAQLGRAHAERLVTGFNRPNLALSVRYTPNDKAKLRELKSLLSADDSAIIYAGTRRDAEEIAEFVNTVAHIPATFYHAGLDDCERTRAQESFMRGRVPIIVATNAFGMGVDKPDIRTVIHFSLPATVEAYYQEIGRAGRDGEPARGVLLYSPEDRALQEWFIENDAPTPAQTLALYRLLPRGACTVAPLDLQRQTGMNDTKLRLALRQLEVAGALRRGGDQYGAMLLQVVHLAQLDLSASNAEVARLRAHKRQLLAQMIRYAEMDTCRRRFILDYFGDPGSADAPECCDNHIALAIQSTRRAESEDEWIPLVLLETVRTLKRPLGRDKIAMIVRGSHARDIVSWGHQQHKFYGKLEHLTLREIGDVIEQLVARGYLKTIGGEYPVVALTPHGEQTLDTRTAISLHIRTSAAKEKHAEKKAVQKAGGTIERTRELVEQGLTVAQIAASRGLAISTIYGHLEQLVANGKIAPDRFIEPAVREQILVAMKQWDGQWLSSLKALLPEVISYDQIRFVVAAQKTKPSELSRITNVETPEDAVTKFLATARPKSLRGIWHAGYALDFNSKFAGAKWARTDLGELVHRFKYASDASIADQLAARLAEFIRSRSDWRVELILPIPSTQKERPYDPVPLLARALGKAIGTPVNETALIKTRATELQKALTNLAQKQANVRGAFCIADANRVQGKHILLLDDFYDSGATLSEATRVTQAAGAFKVYVLTLTKTIHTD